MNGQGKKKWSFLHVIFLIMCKSYEIKAQSGEMRSRSFMSSGRNNRFLILLMITKRFLHTGPVGDHYYYFVSFQFSFPFSNIKCTDCGFVWLLLQIAHNSKYRIFVLNSPVCLPNRSCAMKCNTRTGKTHPIYEI